MKYLALVAMSLGLSLSCRKAEQGGDEETWNGETDGEVYWDEAQVWYDTSQSPTDVTQVESIEFHVPTNTTEPRPFDFCISDISAIMR